MAEQHGHGTPEQAAEVTACWSRPDYQVVETSLEVTAYYGARS
ncbi:hypothetical protein ACRYCC_05310 [Actinomadura scrupuli]